MPREVAERLAATNPAVVLVKALLQEARERDRAPSLAERIARLRLDAGKVSTDAGRMVAVGLQAFAAELGACPCATMWCTQQSEPGW